MSTISRTAIWTIAVVVIIFLSAWGINRHRMQPNEPNADSAGKSGLTPANPQGDWPRFHGDRAQTGFVPGELPDKLSLAWRFKAGGDVKSSPAVSKGKVYFGSSDRHLYCLNVETGKQLWSTPLDDGIEASPTVIDDAVYTGTLNGTLYALNAASGDELWKFGTGDKIMGGVNWFRDSEDRLRILSGSYDATLYCTDARTGASLWAYETGNFINGSPAVDGSYCVFGGCDAVIHVLSVIDGKKAGEIDSGAYIAGSAAIRGGYAYVGNYDGELLKVSLDTFEVAWRYRIDGEPFVSSPAVTDDVVVIGGGDMNVHCIDNETGQARWTYKTLDAVDSSPVIVSDRVLAGSDDGRLYLLGLSDGSPIWSYETGRPITSSPAVADGMVVVGCDDGTVYCFK